MSEFPLPTATPHHRPTGILDTDRPEAGASACFRRAAQTARMSAVWGRFFLGLVSLLFVGGNVLGAVQGVTTTTPKPTPAALTAAADADKAPELKLKPITGEAVTFRTSSDSRQTLYGEASGATAAVLVNLPTCPAVTAGLQPADGGAQQEVTVAKKTPTAGMCLIHFRTTVSPRDPAAGLLVVQVGDTWLNVGYTVVRTSRFEVYLGVLFLALLVGCVAWACVLAMVQGKAVPGQWKIDDAYVTNLTGIAATAFTLTGLTGFTTEFAPQYSISGVVTANVLVALVLACAPLAFAVFRPCRGRPGSPAPRRSFAFATAITVTAAAGQLGLVAVTVLSGTLQPDYRWVVGAVVLAIVVGLGLAAVLPVMAFDEGDEVAEVKAGEASAST